MIRRIAVAAIVAAVTLTVSDARAQEVKQQGANFAAARAGTNKSWDELLAAAKVADAATSASHYTTDAIIIDPGMAPLQGRTNIEKMMKDWYKSSKFLGMSRKAESIEVYGDVAIESRPGK